MHREDDEADALDGACSEMASWEHVDDLAASDAEGTRGRPWAADDGVVFADSDTTEDGIGEHSEASDHSCVDGSIPDKMVVASYLAAWESRTYRAVCDEGAGQASARTPVYCLTDGGS